MRYNDALDVSSYIINYCTKRDYLMSNLKLQKILYFSQAYFLLSKHEPCFDDTIEAWDIGPVIPAAYKEYKKYGSGNIWIMNHCLEEDCYNDIILDDDKKLICAVVDRFADYSAADLARITRNQSPWMDAYVPNRHNEITVKAIEEYFSA